jgi:hypothetical protein
VITSIENRSCGLCLKLQIEGNCGKLYSGTLDVTRISRLD